MLASRQYNERQQPLMPSRKARGRQRRSRQQRPYLLPSVLAAVLLAGGSLWLLWRLLPAADRQGPTPEELRDSEHELHLLHHSPSQEFCALAAPPLVCAHGGDVGAAPPNTARAFGAAVDAGVRCVEVDAAMTKDGHLVVLHSRELAQLLDRQADGQSPTVAAAGGGAFWRRRLHRQLPQPPPQVGDYTWAQLQHLRWEGGEGVELVHDVVAAMVPLMEQIVLDVKTYMQGGEDVNTDAMAQAVQNVVRSTGCSSKCLIWAKADAVISTLKELYPAQRAGIIVMNETAAARAAGMHNVQRLPQAEALGMHYAMAADRQLVQAAQAAGKQVLAWTANTAGMMRDVLDAGVDAVVTNYPRKLQGAIASRLRACQSLQQRTAD